VLISVFLLTSEINAKTTLPPSWEMGGEAQLGKGDYSEGSDVESTSDYEVGYDEYGAYKKAKKRRRWYEPQVYVGAGLNLPELMTFETWFAFGKYFALRAFYTPLIPLNIRVEMPTDVMSAKKGLAVVNPDFTIKLRLDYGPHYGLETIAFPFGNSFFISAGASYRKMRLVGRAKSPFYICSVIEAAKEPPCGNEDARIQTSTELELEVDAVSTAILYRGSFGWLWHVGASGYLAFDAGLTKPTGIKRSVDVTANVDSPGTENDDDYVGALAAVKEERQNDMEDKALTEMRPTEEKALPIIGLSVGYHF